MEERNILVSRTQLKAIMSFFSTEKKDILYGGAARGGKSEVIGIILSIVISAFPGSAWLISRTGLADLKATTLATFFKVIKRFGYGDDSYRDRVRDERHYEFVNNSKLFVIQTNYEPSDPEYDRVGSYGYTGVFLDEGQQMDNKVREVCVGRLSELNGSFSTEVPIEYKKYKKEQLNPGYTIKFKIVGETVRDEKDKTIDDDLVLEKVIDGPNICYIIGYEILTIPYKLIEQKEVKGKLIHTYSWNFKGCIFTGCNPGSNFTRTDFYRPWKSGELPITRDFIPSKVVDNPWIDPEYIKTMEDLPENSVRKQRLLYGNFDYDDSPGLLFDQNTIETIYKRAYSGKDKNYYLTIDAARLGKDSTEIFIWQGLDLREITTIEKADLVTQTEKIQTIINKYGIRIGNVIVDEVGVGGGLVDMLGCRGFVGNSQPLHPYSSKLLHYKKRNYTNLRTQAFYYLQQYLKDISAIDINQDIQVKMTEELLTVKEKDVDNDKKLQIVPKSEMKREIGRSPDLADALSMRMYWLIKEHYEGNEVEYDKKEIETKDDLLKFLLEEDDEEPIFDGEIKNFDIYK